jgi:hypothetical protein
MKNLIAFINLFVVPAVGAFLYLKRERLVKFKNFSSANFFNFFFVYPFFCVLNLIASKIAVYLLLRFFFRILRSASAISEDSVLFTMVSLFSVLVLYFVFVIFTEVIQIRFLFEKKNDAEKK